MAVTPEVLQRQFGLPAELGSRAMPRIVHAFRGERPSDRRNFLVAFYPAAMSGALKAEGEHKWVTADVNQAEIAKRAGCTRATVTRRFSKVSEPAEGYETPADRRAHAKKLRERRIVNLDIHREDCEACKAGEPCGEAAKLLRLIGQEHSAEHYEREATTPILKRQRRFNMANSYGLNMAERAEMLVIVEAASGTRIKKFYDADKAAAACERLNAESLERGQKLTFEIEIVPIERGDGRGAHYHYPDLPQLLADPGRAAYWDPEHKGAGFKHIDCWHWDPRIMDPETGRALGTIARLVMSCYQEKGLLDEFRDEKNRVTKHAGILEIHQKVVARYLGIDVKTVRKANRVWEKLGVLRIVSGDPKMTPKGWRRGRMKVLYLPLRMLTPEEAAREQERAEKRFKEIIQREGTQRLAQLMEMRRLHAELLTAWTGREHCMTALYRELARRLHAAYIFPDLIAKYIPPTRPPDHPDCASRT
jgi:hypothetical protein